MNPPGSQASSRGEAKDSALLSSRDAGLSSPLSGLKGEMEKLFNLVIKKKTLFHRKVYQRYDPYHEGE